MKRSIVKAFNFKSLKSMAGFSPANFGILSIAITIVLWACLFAAPAFAHHPFVGSTPGNAIEGFLSGLGHPIIGPDHFAFLMSAGLLAVIRPKGMTFLPRLF